MTKLHEDLTIASTEPKAAAASKGAGFASAALAFVVLWVSDEYGLGLDEPTAQIVAGVVLGAVTSAIALVSGRRRLSPTSAVSAGFNAKLAQRLQDDRNIDETKKQFPSGAG